jgi:hypothetical protein
MGGAMDDLAICRGAVWDWPWLVDPPAVGHLGHQAEVAQAPQPGEHALLVDS